LIWAQMQDVWVQVFGLRTRSRIDAKTDTHTKRSGIKGAWARPKAGILPMPRYKPFRHAVLEADYDRHFTTYNFASYSSGKNPLDFNQENVSALSLHGRQRGANADNADMTCKGSAGNVIDISKNLSRVSFVRKISVCWFLGGGLSVYRVTY
jgi:hypothetical protein